MQLPGDERERPSLHAETRHSALLLGGALGLMSALAALMFFVSRLLVG